MRFPRIATLVALAALGLTACGGSDGSVTGAEAPETASFAPASAAVFASIDTDSDGEQWQNAQALLAKFPARDKLIDRLKSELEDDNVDFDLVKSALGPEVGFTVFDLRRDDPPAVFFTRPSDPAKLKALLSKSDDPPVTKEIDGWTVAAETQAELARFETEQGGESLADSGDFQDALESVDAGGVLVYIAGREIQNAFDEGLQEEGAPKALSEQFGTLHAFVASASAESDGVSFDSTALLDKAPDVDTYTPALDEAVPEKPLLFVSASNLNSLVRKALESASESIPNFDAQRAQLEQALGFSIESDVLPLIGGEVAVALYGQASSTSVPVTVDIVLAVDDEEKAERLLDRVGALVALGGSGASRKLPIGGETATQLTISGVSLYWLVTDGQVRISTTQAGLEALQASTPRLADDSAYTSALEAAGAPDKVIALLYSDLEDAVIPFAETLEPEELDAETRENLKALKTAVTTVTADGENLEFSGFLGIG